MACHPVTRSCNTERMPKTKYPKMDAELAHKCRELVRKVANEYQVPPAFIVAHLRSEKLDEARRVVWRRMIGEFGMKRQMVADIFSRDRRRLRRSVIGV